jgi:hypothetical protein
MIPTAMGERPSRMPGAERQQCREVVMAVIRAAGVPLIRKDVTRALKTAGSRHGAGTVAKPLVKALAKLTNAKELVNHKDKRGYRLPEWVRPHPLRRLTTCRRSGSRPGRGRGPRRTSWLPGERAACRLVRSGSTRRCGDSFERINRST